MKRVILLVFSHEDTFDLGKPLSEITWSEIIFFNHKEVNLLAATRSFERSALMFKLTHPEFDVVPEGCVIPYYSIDGARMRYPFLFTGTNPLLYRKF